MTCFKDGGGRGRWDGESSRNQGNRAWSKKGLLQGETGESCSRGKGQCHELKVSSREEERRALAV